MFENSFYSDFSENNQNKNCFTSSFEYDNSSKEQIKKALSGVILI